MGIITRHGRTIDTPTQREFFGPSQNPVGEMNAVSGMNLLAATGTPEEMTTPITMGDGTAYFMPLLVTTSGIATGVVHFQGTQGNYVGDNSNYVRLYKMRGRAAYLVAETADSESIWESPVGYVNTPFLAPYALEPGHYVVGFLCNRNTTTTSPVIGGMAGSSIGHNWGMDELFTVGYSQTNQASLPSTLSKLDGASTGLTASAVNFWVGLY